MQEEECSRGLLGKDRCWEDRRGKDRRGINRCPGKRRNNPRGPLLQNPLRRWKRINSSSSSNGKVPLLPFPPPSSTGSGGGRRPSSPSQGTALLNRNYRGQSSHNNTSITSNYYTSQKAPHRHPVTKRNGTWYWKRCAGSPRTLARSGNGRSPRVHRCRRRFDEITSRAKNPKGRRRGGGVVGE